MTGKSDILARFDALNVWRRGAQRAPHKPLLVLYALGRWSAGERGPIHFQDLAPVLTQLLEEFGPSRRAYHPEYPFWRLQNDGVWALDAPPDIVRRQGQTDATKRELLKHDVAGQFSLEVREALESDPALLREIAQHLLDAHFPESIHEDILSAVGLSLDRVPSRRAVRDPAFRQRVLVAYEYRCAVCGWDMRLGNLPLALEAAHIMWHQAGGPDIEPNGFALCSLHHKLLDLGALTVNQKRRVLISDLVNGTVGMREVLMEQHGKQIRPAQRKEWAPERRYLEWHRKEVFKGAPRG